ncbi:carbohydrate ABC transporter permease [Actinopolymorpha sp. NPDC004070]|uniref:carbohydrate ABC transporter permease n=1 Tax=Actinopolymorpha sp. NPDC004070 TaxID=3154548 RepID=UPI0033A42C0F
MMVSLNWLDTFQGVILPSGASAFGAFFVRQAMLAVPDEMVQAARIDGASEFRIFLTMGVPLARGALSILAVLTFLGSWNDFLWPSIALRSPERQTYPVGLANLVGFYNTEYGIILAGSFLVSLPPSLTRRAGFSVGCRCCSPIGVFGPSWLSDAGFDVRYHQVRPCRGREHRGEGRPDDQEHVEPTVLDGGDGKDGGRCETAHPDQPESQVFLGIRVGASPCLHSCGQPG